MNFVEVILSLSKDVPKKMEYAVTEEATKQYLVIPFIQALGYDVFNPSEVVPEYTADVGVKQGERVDYAILKDGEPIMLFECKCAKEQLDARHMSQLYRYFQTTSAKIGVLTNGLQYQFFTDLDEANKMDAKPFFELDLLDLKGTRFAKDLNRFTKAAFNVKELLPAAVKLRYTKDIKRVFADQLSAPSPDFVKFFASQVYSGKKTSLIMEMFAECSKEALNQFISDRITDRFQSAIKQESESGQDPEEGRPVEEEGEEDVGSGITDDERQAYYLVKGILWQTVDDPERVVLRDYKKGARVLLGSVRKPICHLWFGESEAYFSVFNEKKEERQLPVETLSDIYKYADQLRAVVTSYEQPAKPEITYYERPQESSEPAAPPSEGLSSEPYGARQPE